VKVGASSQHKLPVIQALGSGLANLTLRAFLIQAAALGL
jgi:hypothetical protein